MLDTFTKIDDICQTISDIELNFILIPSKISHCTTKLDVTSKTTLSSQNRALL